MYRLEYSRAAARDLIQLPVGTRRVKRKLAQLTRRPREREMANVKKLKGDPGLYRLRVGDWRAVYTIDRQVINIIRIQSRGGVYN
jgi:mRNA interferase RelE/StbE